MRPGVAKAGSILTRLLKKTGIVAKGATNRETNKRVSGWMLGTGDRFKRALTLDSYHRRMSAFHRMQAYDTDLSKMSGGSSIIGGIAETAGIHPQSRVLFSKTIRQARLHSALGVAEDLVGFAGPRTAGAARRIGSIAATGGSSAGRFALRRSTTLSQPGIRGNMIRGSLGGGALATGGIIGTYRGSKSVMGLQTAPKQTGVSFTGPGYTSWNKSPGQGMPANHLSTAGLTQALHRTRHK